MPHRTAVTVSSETTIAQLEHVLRSRRITEIKLTFPSATMSTAIVPDGIGGSGASVCSSLADAIDSALFAESILDGVDF